MSRRAIGWLLSGVVIAAAVAGAWWWNEHAERAAAEQRARYERERAEREAVRMRRLRRESEHLMPQLIEGVYLGMPLDELRRTRPRIAPELRNRNPEAEHTLVFEERFDNGSRGVYVVGREGRRLQRVQLLSMIPLEGVSPHLTAMNEQYGTPTGIWDCPQTGGVPTRRFTWRHGAITVSDVFLVYAGRASVTLYVAPNGVIEHSLRIAGCRPVRDRDRIAEFPMATPEQVTGAQQGRP